MKNPRRNLETLVREIEARNRILVRRDHAQVAGLARHRKFQSCARRGRRLEGRDWPPFCRSTDPCRTPLPSPSVRASSSRRLRAPMRRPCSSATLQDVSLDYQLFVETIVRPISVSDRLGARRGQDHGQGEIRQYRRHLCSTIASSGRRWRRARSCGPITRPALFRRRRPTPIPPPTPRNFDADLGVVYAASGLALIKVASAPAVGPV